MATEFMKYLDKSLKYLHRQGAFLTVADDQGRENVMTISWGNIGFEWGRPIFTVLVRQSRFTHEIIENAKEFTVSVPTRAALRDQLAFAGTKSGRFLDKFAQGVLTKVPGRTVQVSTVKESDIVYECRIVYHHAIDPNILAKDVDQTSYMDGDYHTIYYGEIVDCYPREA
ncbi:Flavoredoxin [Clostridiaceae bacterium JG1575]|nr:Flavoredoxin [Clostridiaceae bacterium JG1575]